MRLLAALSAALVLGATACTTIPVEPERVVLLDPARGSALFQTCSRTPIIGASSFFTPSASEITTLETRLAQVLALRTDAIGPASNFAFDPGSYRREYVGYIADDERMIYGNFAPIGLAGERVPTVVCDGGPAFFGVEYAISSNTVRAVRFDNSLGGPSVDDITQ